MPKSKPGTTAVMASIIYRMEVTAEGSDDVSRIRIGISPPPGKHMAVLISAQSKTSDRSMDGMLLH